MTREELHKDFEDEIGIDLTGLWSNPHSLKSDRFYIKWLEDKCIEQSETIEIFRQTIMSDRNNKDRF